MLTESQVKKVKLLVTGVGGQLGHDVLNEAAARGYEVVGSDIQDEYAGIADASAVTTAQPKPNVRRCLYMRLSIG